MKPLANFRWLTAALLACCPFLLAQDEEKTPSPEYRSFTDQTGRTIIAKPKEFIAATKKLRIELQDGKSFEIKPGDLSIDDQIFIKEWMKTAHQSAAKPIIQHKFEAQMGNTLRKWTWTAGPDISYPLEDFQARFMGSVRNMGREPLNGVLLEAATLYYDQVQVYEPGPYRDAFLNQTSVDTAYVEFDYSRERLRFRKDVVEVKKLTFNGELRVEPAPLAFQREPAAGARSRNPRSDMLAGILIRLVTPDGLVLMEDQHMLDEPKVPVTWAKVDEAVKNGVDWVEATDYQPYTDTDGNLITPTPRGTPLTPIVLPPSQ